MHGSAGSKKKPWPALESGVRAAFPFAGDVGKKINMSVTRQ
jgi:hypothetical protein